MPVMDESLRKERAERMWQLRFEEGLSPADVWRAVKPDNKAKDPAELYRREIRWHRKTYGVVDAPEESRVVLEGDEASDLASLAVGGPSVEVTGDTAVKPVKWCAGVADTPCGKEISGRSPRCDDCRKEHERLRRHGNNRNYYADNKWARWAKRMKAKVEARFEAERVAAEKRVEAEAARKREVERRRQIRIIQAEIEAMKEELRAQRATTWRMLKDGRAIEEYPDGRRRLWDTRSGPVWLQPGEPIPPAVNGAPTARRQPGVQQPKSPQQCNREMATADRPAVQPSRRQQRNLEKSAEGATAEKIVKQVIDQVRVAYGYYPDQFTSKDNPTPQLEEAWQAAMFIASRVTSLSPVQLGAIFGCDSSTVRRAVTKITAIFTVSETLRGRILSIDAQIREEFDIPRIISR